MIEKSKKIHRVIGGASRQRIIIVILFLFCLFEARAIVVELRAFNSDIEQYGSSHVSRLLLLSDPVTPNEIQPWMTFAYINIVFKLPPSYLKEKLSVSDPAYPNISINRYVKRHDGNGVLFIENLKEAVSQYKSGI